MILTIASTYSASYTAGELVAIAVLATLAVGLGLRTRRPGRDRRARTTDAIVALVCSVLLVGAVVRFVDHHTGGGGPFDTQQGREMRAGFVAGCEQGTTGLIDCNCAFEHLTSAPPYDTPEGFITLAGPISEAVRTQSVRGLPPQYVAAMTSCRTQS